jgi:hypothetical protein
MVRAKADREWVLRSDLELAAMLWAEASQEIVSYSCDVDTIWTSLSSEGYSGSKPDISFQRYKGRRGLCEVKHERDGRSDPRAPHAGSCVRYVHADAVGVLVEPAPAARRLLTFDGPAGPHK